MTDKTIKNEEMSNPEIAPEHLALCPLDGRYSKIGKALSPYFSEYALVKNRVRVEVQWLKFLLENIKSSQILASFDKSHMAEIESISNNFSGKSFARIKEIEAVTNHDVKAVELFVGEQLKELGFDNLISFVHFGCTSEDINNTSYATMIKSGIADVWMPAAIKLVEALAKIAKENKSVAMLAHTHGQPATPTTLGKEMAVFVSRFVESLKEIRRIKPNGKFNGATGNYSAITVAFPEEDWQALSKKFIEEYLGLNFNPTTTQIENHDYMCHIFDAVRNFNNILLDLDIDMWTYISMEYFKQIPVKTEVGSSTMPHKVNPIRFENSEANIDISNAIFTALSNKLPRSRMQRDLSDSSSQRNIGIAFGYSLQAIEQTIGGLNKVSVNKEKLAEDLNNNWEVLAEPIQTLLRKSGRPDAYNLLKELTRGRRVSKEVITDFVRKTDGILEEDKPKINDLTPSSYIGLATEIAEDATNKIQELND